MTITDALYRLQSIKDYTNNQIDPDDVDDFWSKDIEALDMAIAALSYFKSELEG